jgi:hypothetical protein
MIDCAVYVGETFTLFNRDECVLSICIENGVGQYKDDFFINILPKKVDVCESGQYYFKIIYERQ